MTSVQARTSRITAATCTPPLYPRPREDRSATRPPRSINAGIEGCDSGGTRLPGSPRGGPGSWRNKVAAPIVKAAARERRWSRTEPVHDRRHRPARHGAFAGCDAGMRHADHGRHAAFPIWSFCPKPGQAKCVQIEIDPTRIGLRIRWKWGWSAIARPCLRALLPLVQTKSRPGLSRKSAETHGELERADGRARHAHRHADEAAGRHLSPQQTAR